MMLAQIAIKKRFGKNAIFKGMDMQEGATTRERNEQIGGHKAWCGFAAVLSLKLLVARKFFKFTSN